MLDFGFYNMDCMEGMKEFPDKYFDLAIVDPPYGDGGGGYLEERNTIRSAVRPIPRTGFHGKQYMGGEIRKKIIAWDVAPGDDYFKELFRISRNQVIWGGIISIYHRQEVS